MRLPTRSANPRVDLSRYRPLGEIPLAPQTPLNPEALLQDLQRLSRTSNILFFRSIGQRVRMCAVVFCSTANPVSGFPTATNFGISRAALASLSRVYEYVYPLLPWDPLRSHEIRLSRSMYHPSAVDSLGCDCEPSSGVSLRAVITCVAACPKIFFRSPVSTVVISISTVGSPGGFSCGSIPLASICPFLNGPGGYGAV